MYILLKKMFLAQDLRLQRYDDSVEMRRYLTAKELGLATDPGRELHRYLGNCRDTEKSVDIRVWIPTDMSTDTEINICVSMPGIHRFLPKYP